ncbi:MAG: FAD-dependent oxidoreductase [Mobilitalea sp.]
MEIKENDSNDKENKGARTLVKCLVCGEIFDSSLDICPVCKAGRDKFVPYEEVKIDFRKDTNEVYVILGNGVAGISAAEAIRERNETATILIISNEAVSSYNRPMLTKALSTLVDAKEIAIHEDAWYEEKNIINMLNTTVESIDIQNKTILFKDATEQKYDKCIYALGAECFIPPFAGANKPQVIAIRNIADVAKIRALMPGLKNTVVIGGGVLGLEAAWEMSKCSKVTVLEVADKLMGRQLDDVAGKLLGEIIVGTGIDFRVNVTITEITGEEAVTGVKLEDGTIYPADLVIVSCGIRANSTIAKDAGIEIDRAVVVNERMETSVADIYACGDCAQYLGINYAIWPEGLEMGKVAGANAAGDSAIYELVSAALTFEGMNTELFAAGDNGKNPKLSYITKEYMDTTNKIYKKYYIVEDSLVGVILIGDTSKLVDMTKALKEGRSMKRLFI